MRGLGGSWRAGNVPLPEAHLIGAAAAAGLHRLRPAALPGAPALHRVAGATLVVAAAVLITRLDGVRGGSTPRPRTDPLSARGL